MIRSLAIQKQIIQTEMHELLEVVCNGIKPTFRLHQIKSGIQKLVSYSGLWIASPVAEVRCINGMVDRIKYSPTSLIDWKLDIKDIVFNANQIEQ